MNSEWPDNIVADRHEVTGKWVLWYLTDEQAEACNASLSNPHQPEAGDVERAAMAICEASGINADCIISQYPDTYSWQNYIDEAKAAIAAITSQHPTSISKQDFAEALSKLSIASEYSHMVYQAAKEAGFCIVEGNGHE